MLRRECPRWRHGKVGLDPWANPICAKCDMGRIKVLPHQRSPDRADYLVAYQGFSDRGEAMAARTMAHHTLMASDRSLDTWSGLAGVAIAGCGNSWMW